MGMWKKIWISLSMTLANWNEPHRNEMKRMNERTNEPNDLQWNHVKIENSSWQPTQQWFYFSYFAFWLKIENGERNAEHTTNGWKLKLVHTRRSTLYFQPVWQINFLLSFTVSFRLLNIMHGIVIERVSKRASERVCCVYALLSICCLRYHCRYWQISCTNYLTRRSKCHRFNHWNMIDYLFRFENWNLTFVSLLIALKKSIAMKLIILAFILTFFHSRWFLALAEHRFR